MKWNKNKFIEKANEIHDNKYDYSKVDFKTIKDKILIICPEHGEFKQSAQAHLKGHKCKFCRNNNIKYTKETFIQKATIKHGNRYDYSKVVYVNNKTNVTIICKEHGEFNQRPDMHLKGHNCPNCYKNKTINKMEKLTEQEFITRANLKYNNKFDYRFIYYHNSITNIFIICPIHGIFKQTPKLHLNTHCGCKKCADESKSKPLTKFIEICNNIHNNIYDYSLIKKDYITSDMYIDIICSKHGKFNQLSKSHLNGNGCKKCAHERNKLATTFTKEEFIDKAISIFGNIYDYSKVEYVNSYTQIEIICKEHGTFNVKPGSHLNNSSGCPVCNTFKNERIIYQYLKDNNYNFIYQKEFDDCKFINNLRYDFYLIDYNLCIEYDGEQHFRPIDYYGGLEAFEKIKINDGIKNKYCLDNNIPLYRIIYKDKTLSCLKIILEKLKIN